MGEDGVGRTGGWTANQIAQGAFWGSGLSQSFGWDAEGRLMPPGGKAGHGGPPSTGEA